MFAFFLEFRVTTRLRPFVISETGLKILVWTQKMTLVTVSGPALSTGLMWRGPVCSKLGKDRRTTINFISLKYTWNSVMMVYLNL